MSPDVTTSLHKFITAHPHAWDAFTARHNAINSNPHNPKHTIVHFEYSQTWGGWLITMAIAGMHEYTVNFRDYMNSVIAVIFPDYALILTPSNTYIGASVGHRAEQ